MTGHRFRPSARGFTLVEMLIALTIFGMITAAGVALLTLTVRTQETSERLLGALGDVRRTGALLAADLGQAAPRLRRDAEGRSRPAFLGSSGNQPLLLALVRRGWDDGGEAARSSVQRVEYRLRDGRLERLAFDRVDGAAAPVVVALLEDVRDLRLRYREKEGGWVENWAPSDPTQLPAAVELVTQREGQAATLQLFLVGTGR